MSAPELIPTLTVSDDFRTRVHQALGDQQLRNNFRSAMDSLMAKRAASFSDAHEREHLRALGNAIKARALSKLPDLLEQLEQNLTRNGVTVHWAETVDEANGIVLSIIRAHESCFAVVGHPGPGGPGCENRPTQSGSESAPGRSCGTSGTLPEEAGQV
ncbi:LUD domain-containing protein, partial [Pseudomonas chlororaphis]|uniref:LUD domain-containing protein n=1 Tax=Pseudomonas chlororaphis TaxID=587753 RepID=UPI001FF087A7